MNGVQVFFFFFSLPPGFFPQFCDVHTGYHPQDKLARSERKVENLMNPAIFWQPDGIYCLNMAILEGKKSSKSRDCGALFFSEKSFV
jgi:hypothetical protein